MQPLNIHYALNENKPVSGIPLILGIEIPEFHNRATLRPRKPSPKIISFLIMRRVEINEP
jgi:hypothetical protein